MADNEELNVEFTLDNIELNADFNLETNNIDADFLINAAGAVWGGILGDIENQTDLKDALDTLSGQIDSNHQAITEINTTIESYGDVVTYNAADFATSAQGGLADTALQPNDDISELVNNVGYITASALDGYATESFVTSQGYITGINSTDVTTALGYTPYNSSNPAGYITSADLPQVNNGTLTIKVNGSNIATFTANQSGNTTANIVVPDSATWGNITGTLSNQTDLQAALNAKYDASNPDGYITSADLPTLQDLTTQAQMDAINSGANTTNIGQIAANTQAISTETTNRQNADNALQSQIDALVVSSDVFDIVGTYAELQAYDISTVPVNDIIKVLVDSTHNNAATYYRCVENNNVKSWSYIGAEGAYYTKSESDSLFVPQTRTINNYALSNNITLTASDVGAVSPSDLATVATTGDYDDLTNKPTIPTVGNGTITFTQGGVTKGTITTNQSGNTTIALDAGGGTVDQTFDGTSANAQSGVAIQNELDENYLIKGNNVFSSGGSCEISESSLDYYNSYSDNLLRVEYDNVALSGYDYNGSVINHSHTLSVSGTEIRFANEDYYTNITIPSSGSLAIDGHNIITDNNLKTINYQSIIGSGNINISGGTTYTAGNGINITNDTISIDSSVVATQTDISDMATQTWVGNQGYLTSSALTNYVTTDTAQDISGRKTFLGEKAIYFKQQATSNKLGFTLYNPSNTELAALEYRPNTINGASLLALNCPQTTGGYVGFRYWGTPAVNIVAPKVATAGNYFMATHITNGNTTVTASSAGAVDISTLLPDVSNFVTSSTLTTTLADYALSSSLATVATTGAYSDLIGTPTLATVATSGSYNDLTNKPTIPTDTNDLTNGANFIQNKSSATDALSILGSATSNQRGINIGTYSSSGASGAVAIGWAATTAQSSVAYGYNCKVNGTFSIGIGNVASVDTGVTNAIQLGTGTNSTSNSFNVGFRNVDNYMLLDGTTGLIPDARLSTNIARTSDIPTVPTNISDFTNDSGYITNSALNGYATETYVNTGLATKQDTISDLATIRSNANSAVQPATLNSAMKNKEDFYDQIKSPLMVTYTNGLVDFNGSDCYVTSEGILTGDTEWCTADVSNDGTDIVNDYWEFTGEFIYNSVSADESLTSVNAGNSGFVINISSSGNVYNEDDPNVVLANITANTWTTFRYVHQAGANTVEVTLLNSQGVLETHSTLLHSDITGTLTDFNWRVDTGYGIEFNLASPVCYYSLMPNGEHHTFLSRNLEMPLWYDSTTSTLNIGILQ